MTGWFGQMSLITRESPITAVGATIWVMRKNGWGNNEVQEYSDSATNSSVGSGQLTISATRDDDGKVRSARLNTYGIASWQYATVEFSARIPRGNGTWPAVWMLPDDIKSGTPWPLCGEIDLMEHIGRQQDDIHFSIHSEEFNHTKRNNPTSVHELSGISDEFHRYRMDWNEDGFSFSVDDEQLVDFPRDGKNSRESWPYDRKYHLIVNLAMGGYWGGEIDEDAIPARFELGYIRVFQ